MKRNIAKLTSRKFVALLVTTGTGLFSLGTTATAQDAAALQKIPAIVLRPASEQVTDCEIELDRPEGSPGYRLRINIPDSVSMVEVAPSIGSGRSFRIRMGDLPTSTKNAGTPNTSASDSESDLQLRAPKAVMASVKWQHFDTDPKTGNRSNANSSSFANARAPESTSGLKYISNPFFAPAKFEPANRVEESFAVEQLQDAPHQDVEYSFEVEPATLDEISKIKTASLDEDNAHESLSVTTASMIDAGSNLDSISIGPIAIEMTEPSADFKQLASPAPSLLEAEFSPETTDQQAHDNMGTEQDAVFDLTTEALPALPSNNPLGFALPAKITVGGPENVSNGSEYDYWITVTNESQIGIEDLNLSLTTPDGMDVTVIEQAADFDETTKTLTWDLPRIEAGSQTVLRYKASTTSTGQLPQKVVLRQGNNVSMVVESTIRSTK